MVKEAQHPHPVLRIPEKIGLRAADKLTDFVGSWTFLFIFGIFLLFWIILNAMMFERGWDPYPFVFLNLVLAAIAAIQAPIILMSNNRQTQKDRLRAEYDYNVNRKAEREIEKVQQQLNRIEKKLK